MPGNRPLEGQMARPELTIDLRDSVLSTHQLFEHIDLSCEGDPHRRLVSLGLLMGLGARESRKAILTGSHSTERVKDIPLHDAYHVMLDQILIAGRHTDEQNPPEPVFRGLFEDLHSLYRRANRQSRHVSREQFSQDLETIIALKRGYFAGVTPLNSRQKPFILLFDRLVRITSDRTFLRVAKPFIESDTHIPTNYVDEMILRPTLDPSYWRHGGSLLDDPNQEAVLNESTQAWIANEYRYWGGESTPFDWPEEMESSSSARGR